MDDRAGHSFPGAVPVAQTGTAKPGGEAEDQLERKMGGGGGDCQAGPFGESVICSQQTVFNSFVERCTRLFFLVALPTPLIVCPAWHLRHSCTVAHSPATFDGS